MSNYKLIYFDGRGFGEPARQLFHLAGVPFEDIRVSFEELIPGKQSESWLEMKEKTPFGRLPVLTMDGFELAQLAAINRYLAKKFGYAGRDSEEEARVDAIVDEFKDYMECFRPYIYGQRAGKSEEELKKIHDEVFVPVKNKFLNSVDRILKNNKSGYLVGNGLTWADLVVADHLHTLDNIKELDDVSWLNLKKYQEMIYSLPELKSHIDTRPKREM
ncbi:hypothetical protein GCK72_005853 [Caenorhabditis remanei]|uniref:glutathione transferase n=1 Tax=Caenorhabditis remanei TaxID=31234 RepID=A0A6A5HDQ0_CAERE|nr:hypothetical protein GCK72_005853 [Caenorhabditis remanei]KAF1765900.1 hypothetical protein GCK72_005853 [Caenorhabditis remanei]